MTKKEAIQILLSNMNNDNIIGFSPSNILNDNIDKRIFEACKLLEFSISANGVIYRKNIRGFLPALMDEMYQDRKMFKEKMIEAKKSLEAVNKELVSRGVGLHS